MKITRQEADSNHETFCIVWDRFKSMNFPRLPLEESLKLSREKAMLHSIASGGGNGTVAEYWR